MATVSRIDKFIGLFCRISSLLQGSFAKETCNLIDLTNQRHAIVTLCSELHGEHGAQTFEKFRSVGSIKLHVSFVKEPYKRDNILQKRPVIQSILLTEATPQ